jgi:RimJ/RimL family protein N-acetyltransferase
MELRGQRCAIRRWRHGDAESLIRHADNVNVARQLRDRFPHPYTMRDARAFLRFAANGAARAANLAIEVDGQAVGAIGFTPGSDIERYSAEVGYWIGEEYWGRGIVTEALLLLTEDVFARLGLLRMFAVPFADNEASARVLEKAGYTREGLLRSSAVKFGVPRDQWLYARINDRWSAAPEENPDAR